LRPAPGKPLEPGISLINEIIYELNYIKGNIQQRKLVRFTEGGTLDLVIKAAKHYCAVNNLRFVFIEPAITTIDQEMEDEIL
jgi:hypothetical protein